MCDQGYEKIQVTNFDVLLQWYHNEYIPNCLMQHRCQTCDQKEEKKNFEDILYYEQCCQHDIGYGKASLDNLRIYKYIPKGLIEYDCNFCHDDYNKINIKENIKIYKQLNICAHRLFKPHDGAVDCLFKQLNKLIFEDCILLNEMVKDKVVQLIRISKTQLNDYQQDIASFEKYFLQFLKLQHYEEPELYKLEVVCNQKQIIQVEYNNPKKIIEQAALSETYLAYVVESQYLYLYDIKSNKIIIIKYFKQLITDCVFSKDEKYLYVGFDVGMVIRFCVKSQFKKTKRSFFHQDEAKTQLTITTLNQNQIFVQIAQKGALKNQFIQFDQQLNKQIAKYMKFSKCNVENCAYDDMSDSILHVNQKKLEVFSMIVRNFIKSINIDGARYMELLGGNKIICLDYNMNLKLLTFHSCTLGLESELISESVKNCYSNKFQQYSYYNVDQKNSNNWNVACVKHGWLYSIEEKSSSYEFSKFNMCNNYCFIINHKQGALSICYK